MSNFHFLFEEFSALGRAAQEAERQVYFSPTASCAFSRKALEMALRWMIEHDPELEVPEDYSLYLLLTGGDLARLLSPTRCKELDVVRRMGNRGLHEDWLDEPQAKTALRYLHGFLSWLYESYTREHEAQIPISPFRVGQIPSLNQAGGAEVISGLFEGPALELAMRPPPPKAQFSAPEQRVSEQKNTSAREQRADDGMRFRLSESGGGFGGRGNSWFADLWEWFSSLFGRLIHSWSDTRFSVEYDGESRRESSSPPPLADAGYMSFTEESVDEQFSMAMEPPAVYSRREGASNMRTPGVSELTTQQLYIETLLREAGWGSRLDRQEELRRRSIERGALINAWSPLPVSFVLSDELIPEVIIVDATRAEENGIIESTLMSGLWRCIPGFLSNWESGHVEAWELEWISSVEAYFVNGVALQKYNHAQGELVGVDGLSIRGSEGEG